MGDKVRDFWSGKLSGQLSLCAVAAGYFTSLDFVLQDVPPTAWLCGERQRSMFK